jgi:hypothetical protein
MKPGARPKSMRRETRGQVAEAHAAASAVPAPRLVYLYCVLPGEADVRLDGIAPMEEEPLFAVLAGHLQAVVSEVGEDFSEATLNTRIRDLDWLSPRAVRHHEVVDQLYARCKLLLPLAFGAIFRSLESLVERLSSQEGELATRLERLRGREQWDLRLSSDQERFGERLRRHSAALQQMEVELTSKPPGTRFLLEKKLRNLAASEAKRIATGVRSEVHQRLSDLAVEAHRDELPAAAQSPAVRLELRSSYLIEEAGAVGLRLAVEKLSQKYAPLGYRFELTGPWPAFTFAGGLREALA